MAKRIKKQLQKAQGRRKARAEAPKSETPKWHKEHGRIRRRSAFTVQQQVELWLAVGVKPHLKKEN